MTRRARAPKRTNRRAGFTLIEIMAVVMIMGLLMGMVAYGVNTQVQNARIGATKGLIVRVEQALEFYQLDNARFPTADQGLQALVTQPTTPPEPRSYKPGGYIKAEALKDPWGQEFQYRIPGEHNPHGVDIWSFGPDGVDGGDDIANWETAENG